MNGKEASGSPDNSHPCPLLLAPVVTIVTKALGSSGGCQEEGRPAISAATRYTPAVAAPYPMVMEGKSGFVKDVASTSTTHRSSSLKVIKDISSRLTPC